VCGIAGIYVKQPGRLDPAQIDLFVDELLLGIEHRGTDATGIVAIPDGGLGTLLTKSDVPAKVFVDTRSAIPANTRIVLGHTRFATQGKPEDNVNNHPVVYGTCFAVHNGHIANDDLLFREYDLTRLGEVDSEAIPAVISQHGFDNIEEALEKLRGGMAIAVADPVKHPDQTILAKGLNSPLIVLNHEHMVVWASTLQTIRDAWGNVFGTPPREKRYMSLEEGDVVFIDKAGVTFGEFKPVAPVYSRTYMSNIQASQGSSCYIGSTSGKKGGESFTAKDGTPYYECTACHIWAPEEDFDFIGTFYNICDDCSVPTNKSTQRLLERGDNDFEECIFCMKTVDRDEGDFDASSGYFFCSECLEELEYDEGKESKPSTVITPSRVVGSGKLEERRHLYLLRCVAEESEYPIDFIDHLLFRAPIEAFDADSQLAKLRDDFEKEYCFAEDLCNQFERLGGDLEDYLDRQEAAMNIEDERMVTL
jgi:glucosamine--fructose-6-phosphate aminotransferase (isomerizing)